MKKLMLVTLGTLFISSLSQAASLPSGFFGEWITNCASLDGTKNSVRTGYVFYEDSSLSFQTYTYTDLNCKTGQMISELKTPMTLNVISQQELNIAYTIVINEPVVSSASAELYARLIDPTHLSLSLKTFKMVVAGVDQSPTQIEIDSQPITILEKK